MKVLIVDAGKCAGCKACEIACSSYHEGKFSPELSRIRIVKIEEYGWDYPNVCRQCHKAPCMKVCPVEALVRDTTTGVILVKNEDCIGCGQCIEACFAGAIQLSHEKGIAFKCDLCQGDPQCVNICPTASIVFMETNHASQRKAEARARKAYEEYVTEQ